MKRVLKIAGITLGSILGLAIIAIVIAYCTVTSPKRLTRLVQKHLPEYVDFDLRLQQASLTLKTFPDIGLELDQVVLLSPMEGAPSDTLARVGKLTVAADAKRYLNDKDIVVKRCLLDHVFINLFTDEEGRSNLDIFKSESNDTTSSSFESLLDLQEVGISDAQLLYTDMKSGLQAQVNGLGLDVKGTLKENDLTALLNLNADQAKLSTEKIKGDINQLKLDFDGSLDDFNSLKGTVNLNSPDLSLNTGYEALSHDKVYITLPVSLSFDPLAGCLDNAAVGLNDYLIQLQHTDFDLHDPDAMVVNADFSTNTLDIEEVLQRLPKETAESLDGMVFKGQVVISDGHVNGAISDSLMPVVTAFVHAQNAEMRIAQLPYPLTQADLSTRLSIDLNDSINANDIQLSCMMNRSKINVSGNVTDLTDNMALNVNLKSDLVLKDLKKMLPKNMSLGGQGKLKAQLNCKLNELLKAIDKLSFNKLIAKADLDLRDLSFAMDEMQATTPKMSIALTLPATNTAKADIRFGDLEFVYDTIQCHANTPNISLEATTKKGQLNNMKASFNSQQLAANAGTTYQLNTQALTMAASTRYDKTKTDFFNQWNPDADFTLNKAEINIAGMDEAIIVPSIEFELKESELDFKKGGVKIGKSDLNMRGSVTGIKPWMEDHANLMKAELMVNSNCLDVNEIMELTSGLGTEPDTTIVLTEAEKEDNPFMVPEGFDFTFNIKSNKALYRNFEFNDVEGEATIKDGTLMLQEVGFTNEAARMQLTAIYQSPRKNHLFVGMDFHLVDVQIYDLLHMIPEIDTIVPMLKTFDGAAEFHIAAQTNLKSNYDLKMSTFRAAADIEGANLRVKDIGSFTRITDLLDVSTNGEYKIDSIDIQMTAFKNEVDLWPFQIAIGKYKATVDGHYNLNTVGEYHISVTESPLPTRLGLKISGPLNDLSYKLEPCKYPHLYKPNRRSDTEQMVLQLKNKIAERLKATVRDN